MDYSEPDEPFKGELEAAETEEMAEDGPAMLKPAISNVLNDSSADILVRVLDSRPSRGFLGAAIQLPGRTRNSRISIYQTQTCSFT